MNIEDKKQSGVDEDNLKVQIETLSIRARHVLQAMGGEWTLERLSDLGERQILEMPNAGMKTAAELMSFKRRVLGSGGLNVQPTVPVVDPEWPDDKIVPDELLAELTVRSRNVLRRMFGQVRVGDIRALTRDRIAECRGAGANTMAELMAFKHDRFGCEEPVVHVVEPNASDYASLAELVVALASAGGELTDKRKVVLRDCLGVLNVQSCNTYAEVARELGVTRERAHQMATQLFGRIFARPAEKPWSDVIEAARGVFMTHGMKLNPEELANGIDVALGWTGTTGFSAIKVLESLDIPVKELPEGRGYGLNENGQFNWVDFYRAPTQTERRRLAIKTVFEEAGMQGLSVDEIVDRCRLRFPDANIGRGNVRGALNANVALDATGTRMIPYDRTTVKGGRTNYTLNTFFKDGAVVRQLNAAGRELRGYIDKTGLGVIDVWKIWRKYKDRMPVPMPKMGFYMMMRDVGAGGLAYPDYPKIAHPDVASQVGVAAYGWEMYEYFKLCGRPTGTFVEIMYFFRECLGMQPDIALTSAFSALGLGRIEDERMAPYVLHPPQSDSEPPHLLLPSINQYQDFSLIKLPKKMRINPYFLDENGRALTTGTYAKVFFRNLEEKGFAFSHKELEGLLSKTWCKNMFDAYRPVLKWAGRLERPDDNGYWREKFSFGGCEYFVSDDWEKRNKTRFDAWAKRIAAEAGIQFEPYEVRGLVPDTAINR